MSASVRSVAVHGHFYQPPREDPWLEEVPREPSAAPDHDWNRRIERQCYQAVVAAPVRDAGGRIRKVVNCLERMSFNVGPTLMDWLERQAPGTYRAVLEADRKSAARHGGEGNALAMPYHHVILPLASRRDKRTEVRWGIADFRRRFGREPRGMWLPETAVDDETLDVLAGEGIAFTILAPHQVEEAPPGGRPGWYRTRSGRRIAVFVYDGALAHGIAFGALLSDVRGWARAMSQGAEGRDLVLAATDGETFGHHHAFGELALAAVLEELDGREDVRLEPPGAFLSRSPPTHEVVLVEPSSWSCAHGVDRWRRACGCKLNPGSDSRQEWRAPLREGLEDLARGLHRIFQEEGGRYFQDPWEVRDACAAVADWTRDLEVVVRSRASRRLSSEEALRARELLAMERNALRMFTSCGWFFDDLARIETLQVLRYAARALELAGPEAGPELEDELTATLARAHSNDPSAGNGADLFRSEVKPGVLPAAAVAAGRALLDGLEPRPDETFPVRGFEARTEGDGRVRVVDRITSRAGSWLVEPLGPGLLPGETAVRAAEGGPEFSLVPSDLPDPIREVVLGAFRARVTKTRLGPEDRRRLEEGREDLPDVAADAAVRCLERMEGGPDPDAAGHALDLLRLVTLQGRPVPPLARAAFQRLQDGCDGGLSGGGTGGTSPATLDALARLLDFAPPGGPTPGAGS